MHHINYMHILATHSVSVTAAGGRERAGGQGGEGWRQAGADAAGAAHWEAAAPLEAARLGLPATLRTARGGLSFRLLLSVQLHSVLWQLCNVSLSAHVAPWRLVVGGHIPVRPGCLVPSPKLVRVFCRPIQDIGLAMMTGGRNQSEPRW